MIGTKLAHYEITSHLGTGGMGEVYQARDIKLGRGVAVKVLPQMFAKDADRVSRFEREAKLLAALNHPNIAALFGMEETDGRHFLVMELVEGETLADRLRRGAIPVAETLQIALQIVEALEAAHEKGIIHRDLKPANVKLTRDGKVKVLDFGLAKAMEPSGGTSAEVFSNSPTISMAATNAGIILGTAAYMSPEQANGLSADPRSDLFSFGSVLYEMLTGRQPFQGRTLSEVLAAVLVREPDWAGLPPNLNPRIHELVRRCLEKEPKRRWHAAGDVRVEIERLIADPAGMESIPQSSVGKKPLWKRVVPVFAAAAAAAVLASVATWSLRPAGPAPIVTRFSFPLQQDQVLNPFNTNIAVSLDGTKLVYETNERIFLKQMGELEGRPVQGTDGAGVPIFFSPDGMWIGFWSFTEATLKKIAITGGTPIEICKSRQPMGIRWEGDKIIWSEPGKGIVRVSENGGDPETLVSLKPEEFAHGPQILNGGKAVLFTLATAPTPEGWDAAQIVVQPLPSGSRKVVYRGGSDARYLPSGHLVFALGGDVLAVPFDLSKLEPKGGPVVVLEGVMRPFSTASGGANLSLADNGTLAYVPGGAARSTRTVMAFVDTKGKSETLPLPPGAYGLPRISPDGKWLAYTLGDPTSSDIWIYELSGGRAPRKLTLDATSAAPVWTSDSRQIIMSSGNLSGLFWQPADGTGDREPLTKPEQGVLYFPLAVSGTVLAFTPFRGDSGVISLLSLEGERKIEPFADLPHTVQIDAAFSPNGRWLAYMSTEVKGISQVFVKSRMGAKYQVTTTGGVTPLWSPDGNQLFFVNAGRLFAVDIRTEPVFSVGPPHDIPIRGAQFPSPGLQNYDIGKDGRLLVVMPAAQDTGAGRQTSEIRVVLNWLEELKQRVPVK